MKKKKFKAGGLNKDDSVKNPSHYTSGGLEVKDVLKAKLTTDEFKGYLKGNILKYIFCHELKGNPKIDLQKAREYLDMLIALQ